MGKNEYPHLAVDRAHEDGLLADDDFDAAVAAEAREQVGATRERIAAGHAETLTDMAEAWAHKVSQPGVTQQLLHATAVFGKHAGGALVDDLLQKCIDDAAEVAALKVVKARRAA